MNGPNLPIGLYQGREALQRINSAPTADGKATVDLAGIAGIQIGMRGGSERHALLRLARTSGMWRPPAGDVLVIVQSFVHFPVVGLDLDVAAAVAAKVERNEVRFPAG